MDRISDYCLKRAVISDYVDASPMEVVVKVLASIDNSVQLLFKLGVLLLGFAKCTGRICYYLSITTEVCSQAMAGRVDFQLHIQALVVEEGDA